MRAPATAILALTHRELKPTTAILVSVVKQKSPRMLRNGSFYWISAMFFRLSRVLQFKVMSLSPVSRACTAFHSARNMRFHSNVPNASPKSASQRTPERKRNSYLPSFSLPFHFAFVCDFGDDELVKLCLIDMQLHCLIIMFVSFASPAAPAAPAIRGALIRDAMI